MEKTFTMTNNLADALRKQLGKQKVEEDQDQPETLVGIIHYEDPEPRFRRTFTGAGIKVAATIELDKTHQAFGKILLVDKEHAQAAPDGMKVTARVYAYTEYPLAEVIEVLGDPNEPSVLTAGLLKEFGYTTDFPREVEEEAKSLPTDPTEEDLAEALASFRDLRDQAIFTIDGEDARDFDDAVGIDLEEDGSYRLFVHIANVSHYVKDGSNLDDEAYARGNSVYLPDMVLPMLPPRLSNGLCSLNPHRDRLAMTSELHISAQGALLDAKLYESVVQSHHRLTYTQVQTYIDAHLEEYRDSTVYADALHRLRIGQLGPDVPDLETLTAQAQENLAGDEEFQNDPVLVEKIRLLIDLSIALDGIRAKRGNLDFETSETKVIMDAEGKVVDLVLEEDSYSHKMIENFMVAANEFVARLADKYKIPMVFRIHEAPDPEKVRAFAVLAQVMGEPANLTHDLEEPKDFRRVMTHMIGKPYEELLNMVMLRSMAKAVYSEENLGHFGLASTYYCHFTSPIRRYSDLYTHRQLKRYFPQHEGRLTWKEKGTPEEAWEKQTQPKDFAPFQGFSEEQEARKEEKKKAGRKGKGSKKGHGSPESGSQLAAAHVADHVSDTERQAVDCERAAVDSKACQYYEGHLGDHYEATISGFSKYALFVRLPNAVEGAVFFRSLPEYYIFDEDQFVATTRNKDKVLHIGDTLEVQVAKVDINHRFIDFEIYKMPDGTLARGDRGNRGGRGDRRDRDDRRGRRDRGDQGDRGDRGNRGDRKGRHDHKDRKERRDRKDRQDRHDRKGRKDR